MEECLVQSQSPLFSVGKLKRVQCWTRAHRRLGARTYPRLLHSPRGGDRPRTRLCRKAITRACCCPSTTGHRCCHDPQEEIQQALRCSLRYCPWRNPEALKGRYAVQLDVSLRARCERPVKSRIMALPP